MTDINETIKAKLAIDRQAIVDLGHAVTELAEKVGRNDADAATASKAVEDRFRSLVARIATALCDDGSVWVWLGEGGEWQQLPNVPQEAPVRAPQEP